MQRHSMFQFLTSFRDDERGTIAIIVSLISMVLIGFASLAIDGGYLYWTRTQLQAAADSAALAGVQAIPSDTSTLTNTEKSDIATAAQNYARKNMSTGNHGEILAASDVTAGHWDRDTRTFYALGAIPGGENVDAIKVITRRAEANDNALGLMFARVMGFNQTDVTAKAIAYAGPGGAQACILSVDPSADGAI